MSVDTVFSALADPTRRRVIAALAREPSLTASRLAGELPVTRQAVAKHLGALDRAGLVRATRAGRETRYELTPEPLAEAMTWMAGVGARWDASLARLATRAGAAASGSATPPGPASPSAPARRPRRR